jgi:cytochrome c biogenesis protein CcdA
MSYKLHDKQKSLKRRFLLILGATTFICVLTFGLMVIFWSRLNLPFNNWQRIGIGSLIIVYGILRFSRLFRKEPDEE